MLKIGVLGAGHLGKIHLKCIQLADAFYDLVGFYDPDDRAAQQAVDTFGIQRFETMEALFAAVDVVDIVTPTSTHFAVASRAIRAGKHIFIEKPLTRTIEEAEELVKISQEHGVKVQVGHVERFNPALLALEDMPLDPMFIEAHRLAVFNPRGTDVSVVLDLMIHDLDILLSMVKAEVRFVSASGVAVVSTTPDIANARIDFAQTNAQGTTLPARRLHQPRFLRKRSPNCTFVRQRCPQPARRCQSDGNGYQPREQTPARLRTTHRAGKCYQNGIRVFCAKHYQ